MAIPSTTVWELRQDATATTSGGGFDSASASASGGSGVDYSQQASPQYSPSGTLTSAGVGNVILYAAAAADMQGNIINITAGTNFVTGRYMITAVSVGVSITVTGVAANVTTGAGVSGSGFIGGAVQRLQNIAGTSPDVVAGNTIYVKYSASAYTFTTTDTIGADGSTAGVIKIIGYVVGTRSDVDTTEANMPVFTTATNSVAKFTLNAANYLTFRNIKITDTAATRGNGWVNVTAASKYINFINCVADGCLIGFDLGTSSATGITHSACIGCVSRNATGTSSTAHGFRSAQTGSTTTFSEFINCVANYNAGDGFQLLGTGASDSAIAMINCCADTNGRDGVRIGLTTGTPGRVYIQNCTLYNNAVTAVHALTTSGVCSVVLLNNIFYGSGGSSTNILCDTPSVNENWVQFNNAFGHAGSGGNRSNLSAGYGDITLTGDPFVDAPNRNFALNTTAGGGALCRGVGYPLKVGTYDDATATSMDIGASQVQLTSGGGKSKLYGKAA